MFLTSKVLLSKMTRAYFFYLHHKDCKDLSPKFILFTGYLLIIEETDEEAKTDAGNQARIRLQVQSSYAPICIALIRSSGRARNHVKCLWGGGGD